MKKKILIKIFRISALSISLILVFNFISPNFLDNTNAEAIGDLTVNWGVAEGSPIFTVNNIAPGQSQSKTITITNGGSGIRPVGIRGIKTSETNNLSSVLDITISQAGVDLYGGTSPSGPKTLSSFFTESASINGIFLSNVNPSQTKNYIVKVKFLESAGNEFQNSQVVFNIVIGISIDLPDECEQIAFSSPPIFGTSKGDSLKGTNGNDLIIGFEGGDSIDGKGGDDCILGGDGGDSIKGAQGNDFIFGEVGGDSINGGAGNDLMTGGEGGDSLAGGDDNDLIFGSIGSDSLDGGNGLDELRGEEGSDSLKGGSQNDLLIGGSGSDSANGNTGTDKCEAEAESNCELNP